MSSPIPPAAGKRSPEPFVVEVTGPRGVGKSTFMSFLESELRKRQLPYNDLPPVGPGERLLFKIWQSIGRLYTRSIWPKWRPLTKEELDIFQRRFWRYRFRLWRVGTSPGVHLLDEGVYQLMLMSMVKTTLDDPSVIGKKLKRMVRFPDLVIFLSAPEADIEARRKLRGNARDLKKPEMSEASRAGMRTMQAMLEQQSASDGEVMFVRSTDLAALQAAAKEAASLIFDRAHVLGRQRLVPNGQFEADKDRTLHG